MATPRRGITFQLILYTLSDKMKTITINIFAILIAVASLAGCKNKESSEMPSVSIDAPAFNQAYNAGETVHIKADLNHSRDIHEYSVIIKAVANDSNVFSHIQHIHTSNYHIHEHWTNNLNFSSEMIMTITAVDHEGVMGSKSVSFHCQN